MRRRLLALSFLLLAACGSDKQEPAAVSRLVIAPQTTILVQAGTPTSITLEAFGPDGGLIAEPGPITWTSNDPAAVAVDADGGLTAIADLGSAQITASVGNIRSNSVLVVVAELGDGAILVADSEFVGDVELVGELPADPEEPWRLKAVLSKEYAADSLLVSAGDTVFGGRVVSVQSTGAGFETTVETVPLSGLFKNVSINESRPLVVTSSQSAGLVSQKSDLIGTTASAITLGDCKVENGVSLADLQFNVVPKNDVSQLTTSFIWTMADGQTTDFEALVQGPFSVGLNGDIAIPLSFTSKITCRSKLVEAPLFANTGVFGLIGVEAFITLGVGLETGASTVGARVLLDGDLNLIVRAGLDRNPVTGEISFVRDVEAENKVKVGFEFDDGLVDSSVATLNPVVSAGIGSQATAGAGPLRKVFEMAEWKAGITRRLSYATVNGQIQDTNFAASEKRELKVSYTIYEYGLGLMFGWFPGLLPALKVVLLEIKGVVNLLSKLGFDLPDNVFGLGDSPSGSISGPAQVELGQTPDMTITLDHVDELGDYNVREVQILRYSGVGTNLSSETVATIVPSTVGQTVFVWPFDSTEQGVGTQSYAAFVITNESPITPFEIAANSTKVIEVVDVMVSDPAVEWVGGRFSGGEIRCITQVLLRNGGLEVREEDRESLPTDEFVKLQNSEMVTCSAMNSADGTTARAAGEATSAASVSVNGEEVSSARITTAVTGIASVQGKMNNTTRDFTAAFTDFGGSILQFEMNEATVVRLDTRLSSDSANVGFSCAGFNLTASEEGVRTQTATAAAGSRCTFAGGLNLGASGNSGTLSNFSYPVDVDLEATVTFTQP